MVGLEGGHWAALDFRKLYGRTLAYVAGLG